MTWDRWTAVVLSVLVLLGGLGFIVGPNDSAQTASCITEDVREGTAVESGGSLWPPGKRCRYYNTDGSTTPLVKPASLRTLLFLGALVLFAFASPLVVGTLYRRWYARLSA